jgi:predicted dehydrogenase
VKVAVVGTGSAGRRHLETLAGLGVTDLLAVNAHRPGPPVVVSGHEVTTVHALDDALDAAPDAVVVATPTSLHAEATERSVRAGIPVLCEKPLASDGDEAARVTELAEAEGVLVAVCCQFRFHEQLVELRRQLHAGALGDVVDVVATQGEHLADYHPEEDYRTSYAARAELGGGVLRTQVHLLDLVHWLVGPFRRASAVGGRRTDLQVDVEDSVSFLLEADSGIAVRGHVDYFRRPRRFTVDITGTRGNAAWDYYAGTLQVGDADPATMSFDRAALFRATVGDFLDALRDGHAPRTSAREGVAVLRIVDALHRSLEGGTLEPVLPCEDAS